MTSWGETQLAVARDFQEHAVPRYRQLFPRLRDGYYGRREGRALTYDEYVAAVAAGTIVPRGIHGCMHAARVTIYAGLLAQLHRDAGRVVHNLHTLQMAAAFHDVAREDEGRDRWDKDSGAQFGAWLIARGSGEADAAEWSRWLAEKDAPHILSLDHAILHDADALDIQRVTRIRNHFQQDRLWLFRQGDGIPDADKQALVQEARTLIDITDSNQVKRELEPSPDYYIKVMHIVTAFHRGTGSLPLLNALLDKVLAS